jgi:DNA-dependent protein kinase catalytic subunit
MISFLLTEFFFRHLASQRILLMICLGSLNRFNAVQVTEITKILFNAFSSHSDETCRVTLYKILIWLLDNHEELIQDSNKFYDTVGLLLRGFLDDSTLVRRMLLDYWDDERRLPDKVADRLIECLSSMYRIETESQWVHHTIYLILQLCSRSANFNSPISQFPLGEIQFEDMPIDAGWNPRLSLSNAPLFHSQVSSQTDDIRGALLATQDPQFSLTQTIAGMEASQSLTFVMADTAKSNMFFAPEIEDGLGSLNVNNLQRSSRPRYQSVSTKDGQPEEPQQKQSILATSFKRFDSRSNHKVIQRAVAKLDLMKRYEKVWHQQLQEERRHSARVLRKYRVGELPDIQIPLKDLVAPLQALHIDPVISKKLFTVLFSSFHSSLLSDVQKENVQHNLRRVLSGAKHDPTFISSVMLSSISCDNFSVDPIAVGDCSSYSPAYEGGILLLEHQLEVGFTQSDQSTIWFDFPHF